MNGNLVELVFRGQGPIVVDRGELAENMRREGVAALTSGFRPGEITLCKIPLIEEMPLSADALAALRTMWTAPGVTIVPIRRSQT